MVTTGHVLPAASVFESSSSLFQIATGALRLRSEVKDGCGIDDRYDRVSLRAVGPDSGHLGARDDAHCM